MRAISIGLVAALIGSAGCTNDRPFFGARGPSEAQFKKLTKDSPPSSTLAATRVNSVAMPLVQAMELAKDDRPIFITLGVKDTMIFHQGNMVCLSEGLVDRCRSDDELAAVISYELGHIAAGHAEAKRELGGGRPLPPSPRLAPDVVGAGHAADMTSLAEQAALDRRRTAGGERAKPAAASPRTLGQNLYVKAGHSADEFAQAEKLFKEAEENATKREIVR